MNTIITNGYYIILLLAFLKGSYYFLNMNQQEHYNIKNILYHLFYYYGKSVYIIICYLTFLSFLNYFYLTTFIYATLLASLFIKENYILRLKITMRQLRITAVFLLINLLIFLVEPGYLTFIILILTIPFTLILTMLVLIPCELLINNFYKNRLAKELSSISPLIIGITGSFGKTTVKEILYEVIKNKYVTRKTPASYNTPGGIGKFIHNTNLSTCEVLILELGATKKNDIDYLAKVIKPKIGIITSIGPQHLETLKSIDGVLKAKWRLVNHIEESGSLILNYDNKYLNGLSARENIETIAVSKNKITNLFVKNISKVDNETTFDIYYGNHREVEIKTTLNGSHNIDNILMAYATVLALKKYGITITSKEFAQAIINVKNARHRLETRMVGQMKILDDSYNANIEGLTSAINLLKEEKNKTIIITPGIVDTGRYKEAIQKRIADLLIDIDIIILIKANSTKIIKKELLKKGIPFIVKKSFKDAYNYSIENYSSAASSLLIANDLTDCYLKR